MRSKQSKTLCLCGEIFIIHCLVFIAEDINQFKNLFVAQLKNMLSADELGAFILVLANSHQDTFLENELQDALTSTFVALKDNFVMPGPDRMRVPHRTGFPGLNGSPVFWG